MLSYEIHKSQIEKLGFVTIKNIFSVEQIQEILQLITHLDTSRKTFRKSADLFAIRQFFNEVPELSKLVLNNNFKLLINTLFGLDYFIVKSIYFDKPEQTNWFVSYHQDLTISVDRKREVEGYTKWTVKQDQFSVQPPLDILKQIYTVRIHLDNTDANNGALKVIPGSHSMDVLKLTDIDWSEQVEHICKVPEGGVMIMKPLLLHSSSRTTNNQKRRVIHIEFCNKELHHELKWAERKRL